MREHRAGQLWHHIGRKLDAQLRCPWPDEPRPADRLLVASLAGLAFFAAYHGLVQLAALFATAGPVSLFFPVAGLCLLFGFLLGPYYLAVPILAVVTGNALLGLPLQFDLVLHLAREILLYGAAGGFLRLHQGRHPAASVSSRFGYLLVVAIVAVTVNLAGALAIFAWAGALAAADLLKVALVFFLGDLSGILLFVPPVLLLAEQFLERRQDRRQTSHLDPRDGLVVGRLFGLASVFVVLAILGLVQVTSMPSAMTPALLPILIGAMHFGYAVGVGLFSVAATLLLGISAVATDAPNAVALQTVLVVCCIATLTVGAATTDRARLLASLDASVAERTRELDEKNAALTRFNDELRTVATTDHLTGLANRRAFEATLRGRLASPRQDLGLLVLDIDRFKRINDRHGHAAGDQALIHVARLLDAGVRKGDLVARTGGEEFAVICTASDAEGLREVAERLRRMVGAAPLLPPGHAEPIVISVSVGGAVAGPAADMDRLLRAADRALYAAKRAGRNRSRITQPPDAEPLPTA